MIPYEGIGFVTLPGQMVLENTRSCLALNIIHITPNLIFLLIEIFFRRSWLHIRKQTIQSLSKVSSGKFLILKLFAVLFFKPSKSVVIP